MKHIVKIGYIILSILFIVYLSLPNPSFPEKLPNSFQSIEPADIETPLRRAYYTDMSREEVLNYYEDQFQKSILLGIKLPTYRLNYPPEEAQVLIRDQTRSTFLEEIVHPFRESLFINGFKPTLSKDIIIIDGKQWQQKITVKLVESNIYVRVLIGIVTAFVFYFIMNQWVLLIKSVINKLEKLV